MPGRIRTYQVHDEGFQVLSIAVSFLPSQAWPGTRRLIPIPGTKTPVLNADGRPTSARTSLFGWNLMGELGELRRAKLSTPGVALRPHLPVCIGERPRGQGPPRRAGAGRLARNPVPPIRQHLSGSWDDHSPRRINLERQSVVHPVDRHVEIAAVIALTVDAGTLRYTATSNLCSIPAQPCTFAVHGCTAPGKRCNAPLQSCTGPLHCCNAAMLPCRASLHSCNAPLQHCNATLHSCTAPVQDCNVPLHHCNAPVQWCAGSLHLCKAPLQGCNAPVQGCTASLHRCRALARKIHEGE